MRKVAWTTDPHFDFIGFEKCREFCMGINNLGVDALVISGDIGEATNIESYLRLIADNVCLPIYFVLGNHDIYGGSIAEVRNRISRLCAGSDKLIWLPQSELVQLSPETCLLGHDGWADGRNGNFMGSRIFLNDYRLISELRELGTAERQYRLHALGDEAAEYFTRVLPKAIIEYKNLVLITHVPPFREACWHEGKISNDQYLPHFSCQAVGNVLRNMMLGSDAQMTVLCGHTHSRGEVRILPNLVVKTGQAVYGSPAVNEIIFVT